MFKIFFVVGILMTFAQTALASPFVYVTGWKKISVIDLATGKLTSTIAVANPLSITVGSTGAHVYAALNDNTVAIINTSTNSVERIIPVGNYPYSIAIASGGNIYVANQNDCTVSVIGANANKVATTIPVPCTPRSLAVDPSGAYVYVATGGGVSLISTATNEVIATIDPPSNISGGGLETHRIKINHAGTYIYVINSHFGLVWVINVSTKATVATVSAGGGVDTLTNIAISPDDAYVYAVNYDGAVDVIDTATNKVVRSIWAGGMLPDDIAISSDGNQLYLSSLGYDNRVAVIDIKNGKYPKFIQDSQILSPSVSIAVTPDVGAMSPAVPIPALERWALLSLVVALVGLGTVAQTRKVPN